MKRCLFILAVFALPGFVHGQDTLTNEIIVKLNKAGFGKEILISKINNSPSRFDVSLDGMIALKSAGVPDDVINKMIARDSKALVETSNRQAAETRIEQGCYYLSPTGDKIELEPAIMTSAKSGGLGAISGIFNSKSKTSLSGKEAATQIKERLPKFLFVFDTTAINDMNSGKKSFSNVRSPNEFLLVKLDVEKNTRAIEISKSNNLKSSSGISSKNVLLFNFKKLSKGIYEVQPKEELTEGEYCFMYADGSYEGAANKVFDFSIKQAKGF